MPSGARVAGAASSCSSAFSCCRWQREPHRRKPAPACTAVTATVVEPGLLERAKANPKQRFRVIVQSAAEREGGGDAFDTSRARRAAAQQDESRCRQREAGDKAYSKGKAKAERARASAERDSWHARREEAKRSASRLAASSTTGSTSSTASRWRCPVGGSSGSLAAGPRSSPRTSRSSCRIDCLRSDGSTSLVTSTSKQLWAYESGVSTALDGAPRPCRRSRSSTRASTRTCPTSPGAASRSSTSSARASRTRSRDGRGHGSFVAGIAAGSARDYAGAAPNAPLVSLDVMDDSGSGRTSDVIAATEWISGTMSKYNIRVVNYSLHGGGTSTLLRRSAEQGGLEAVVRRRRRRRGGGQLRQGRGPERRAVRSRQQPVRDHGRRDRHRRHLQDLRRRSCSVVGVRPHSDGFWKPEICAPGRYMVGPIPMGSTLAVEKATKIRAAGYIELSGTSFSAPVVAGIVAQILARNPTDAGPGQGRAHAAGPAVPRAETRTRAASVRSTRSERCISSTRRPTRTQALNKFLHDGCSPARRSSTRSAGRTLARADVSWDAVSWTRRLLERRVVGCGLLERCLLDGRFLDATSPGATSPGRTPVTTQVLRTVPVSRLTPERRARGGGGSGASLTARRHSMKGRPERPALHHFHLVSPFRGNSNGGTPTGGCPSARVGIPFETATQGFDLRHRRRPAA